MSQGPHGAPSEAEAGQRQRLLVAATEVLRERGYGDATSAHIAAAAGVPQDAFHRHFDDAGACLLAAYEAAAERLLGAVADGCAQGGEGWAERVGGAIAAALDLLDGEPGLARLLGSEAPIGIVSIDIARVELVGRLAAHLATGRPRSAAAAAPGQERQQIAAAFVLLSEHVREGRGGRLADLGPRLAELLTGSGRTCPGAGTASPCPRRAVP